MRRVARVVNAASAVRIFVGICFCAKEIQFLVAGEEKRSVKIVCTSSYITACMQLLPNTRVTGEVGAQSQSEPCPSSIYNSGMLFGRTMPRPKSSVPGGGGGGDGDDRSREVFRVNSGKCTQNNIMSLSKTWSRWSQPIHKQQSSVCSRRSNRFVNRIPRKVCCHLDNVQGCVKGSLEIDPVNGFLLLSVV